jgi:hypothetical protein
MNDGKFMAEAFAIEERIYTEALSFQTRNSASGSVQFRFSDGGENFREVTKDVDLR